MTVVETGIKGLIILEPRVYEDSRGYFFESFNLKLWKSLGIIQEFVQDNQSKSSYGVIRGLHYQMAPYSQTKVVRVLTGEVLDVALDLRKGSDTFGKSFSALLSAENKRQMLIPKGFAHGFAVLSKEAVFYYKCDELYNPASERGINYKDNELSIDWKIPEDKRIISDKDKDLPSFSQADMNF